MREEKKEKKAMLTMAFFAGLSPFGPHPASSQAAEGVLVGGCIKRRLHRPEAKVVLGGGM
jgi:hypothetical protein